MKVHLNIAMVNLATASVLTFMLSSEVDILVHYADHQSLSWPIMWPRASVRVLAPSNLVKSTRLQPWTWNAGVPLYYSFNISIQQWEPKNQTYFQARPDRTCNLVNSKQSGVKYLASWSHTAWLHEAAQCGFKATQCGFWSQTVRLRSYNARLREAKQCGFMKPNMLPQTVTVTQIKYGCH